MMVIKCGESSFSVRCTHDIIVMVIICGESPFSVRCRYDIIGWGDSPFSVRCTHDIIMIVIGCGESPDIIILIIGSGGRNSIVAKNPQLRPLLFPVFVYWAAQFMN